jgi:hypothetical protein
VIGTFNACSQEPTHQSLTDIGGGYNLGGVSFLHTTLRHSQSMISTIHLRAPFGLRLSNQLLSFDLKREQTLNFASGSLHSTSTVTYHLSIALLMISHQEIGLTRINQKVDPIAITMLYNAYPRNAQPTIT